MPITRAECETLDREDVLAPLRERFHSTLLNIYKGRVDLTVSALPDDDAALLGAAALGTL